MSDNFTNFFPQNDPRMPAHPVMPGFTPPFPPVDQEETVYVRCTVPNHHMHRKDGKRLLFVHGIYATKDIYDIQYLQEEMQARNPYIREATKEEVQTYKMITDPRGTIQAELRPVMEEEIKEQLQKELHATLEARLNSAGVVLTDDQKEKLFQQEFAEEQQQEADALAGQSDQDRIAGTDALARLRANFGGGIKSGSGTIIGEGSPAPGTLGGITGTDKLATAADSNQGGAGTGSGQ